MLGGQVGVKDHITIGAGARVGAQSGVTGDVPAGAFFSGYPARPHQEQMRVCAYVRRLPELLRTVHDLEERLAQLQADPAEGGSRET
jgi:UDP-3-O-[3-hydroxymyristoyl] glucosamine N-acyltransferase